MAGGLSQATRGFLSGSSGAGAGPVITSVAATAPNEVTITWSEPVTLTPLATDALAETFSFVPPPGGGMVTALAVELSDPTHVVITTTDQWNGATYGLAVAAGAVQSSALNDAD